ncbi:MAG: hypothetical protein JSV17_18585 [Candidatus Aminicenantes bacterium]|nr:MAG: hypothetical protein JSV17_18585 [Candidatus Aminicenantes bacterium]
MRKQTSRFFLFLGVVFLILAFGLQNGSYALGFQEESATKFQRFAGVSRPDPEGVPTKVSVGIVFLDVTKIDDVTQTFTADFYFIYRWSDPRLDIRGEENAPEIRLFELDEIWNPQLLILNQRNLKDYYEDYFRVDTSGNVQYSQRFFGELSSPLDLKDYCFDAQVLPIQVASSRYGPEELLLSYNEQLTGQRGTFSIAGWTVKLEEPQTTGEYLAFQGRDLARIDFPLHCQRHTGYFFIKLLIPLSLIVLMAWAVFWIDPSALGPQIGLPTSAVFTFILFNFRIGQVLPRISYLTRIDRFVLGATFLVFMALGEAVMTTMLARKGKEDLAKNIDKIARYLYLLLFAIVIIIAFFI